MKQFKPPNTTKVQLCEWKFLLSVVSVVSNAFGSILKELLKPCSKRETEELHECTDICFLYPNIMDGRMANIDGRVAEF